jgi:hypothetical protein
MLRGFLGRATVAIVLMGALLAPLGVCMHAPHRAAHSCCAPPASKTVQADCCTVRIPQPGIVVAPGLPNPAPVALAPEFALSNLPLFPREFEPVAIISPHSPPGGAFNLRI